MTNRTPKFQEMKQRLSSHRGVLLSHSRTASTGASESAMSAATPTAFDGMDENEIVARIMQEVRRCESSARRSLRRPPELSYSLDKNGSIVSNHPHPSLSSRQPELYSVDDAHPIAAYHVELNTDRVGSLTSEMNDAFEYLMTGTPRRNLSKSHSTKKRTTISSVAPRYLSSDSESYVEHYDLVHYNADEGLVPESTPHCSRDKPPPLTSNRRKEVVPKVPPSIRTKPGETRADPRSPSALDQSTSSHSSSSTTTPQPASPTSHNDDTVDLPRHKSSASAHRSVSSSSVVSVPPPNMAPNLWCSGMSSWLGGAATCHSRSSSSNGNAVMLSEAPSSTHAHLPTIYERFSRPFQGQSEPSVVDSRALHRSAEGSIRRRPSQNNAASLFDDMSRGGSSMRSYVTEEEDVDVMRQWQSEPRHDSHQRSISGLSSVRSGASSVITTLETIRERSNDTSEPDSSSMRHGSRRGTYPSSLRRHPSYRYTNRIDSAATTTSRSTARRTLSSLPSEYNSELEDDENTTLYYVPSEAGGGAGGGCMAILTGVLQGIDEAEKAFLGDDDDIWTDLYDDDYDLYSTEASSHLRTRDRSLAGDRSYSTNGRSVRSSSSSLRSQGRYYVA